MNEKKELFGAVNYVDNVITQMTLFEGRLLAHTTGDNPEWKQRLLDMYFPESFHCDVDFNCKFNVKYWTQDGMTFAEVSKIYSTLIYLLYIVDPRKPGGKDVLSLFCESGSKWYIKPMAFPAIFPHDPTCDGSPISQTEKEPQSQ